MRVCATLWANTTFRHLLFCFSVIQFFSSGILQWQPTFFVRSFGMQTGQLGTWFAVVYGMGGLLGTLLGGELASRTAANNERLQLKGMAAVYASFSVISACIYLSSNRFLAFALMAVAAVGGAAAIGPLFATIQTLVPERMRAVSIAIIYLFANLIGLGLGGYFGTGMNSWTALIPAFFGIAIALLGALALKDAYRMHAMHGAVALCIHGRSCIVFLRM